MELYKVIKTIINTGLFLSEMCYPEGIVEVRTTKSAHGFH